MTHEERTREIANRIVSDLTVDNFNFTFFRRQYAGGGAPSYCGVEREETLQMSLEDSIKAIQRFLTTKAYPLVIGDPLFIRVREHYIAPEEFVDWVKAQTEETLLGHSMYGAMIISKEPINNSVQTNSFFNGGE